MARRITHYVAPDLLFSEAGNAVWKKVRRKELNEHEGRQLVLDLTHVALKRLRLGVCFKTPWPWRSLRA